MRKQTYILEPLGTHAKRKIAFHTLHNYVQTTKRNKYRREHKEANPVNSQIFLTIKKKERHIRNHKKKTKRIRQERIDSF